MEEVQQQVRRAYQRLGFQRFLGVLGWCWFATLLAALGLIVVDRFHRLGVAPWGWAAGALGFGLVLAVAWMLATRRGPLAAAIEVDRRFGLKERVSSALAMSPEDQQTEAGQALVQDAVRRVERIDVASQFRVRPGKQALLPLLPAALALPLAFIPATRQGPTEAKADSVARKQQVRRSAKTLRTSLAQRRKKAQQKGLKDAERLFEKLEEGTRKMAAGKTQRKKALVTLNDLSRKLQKRRSQVDADEIQKQLDRLKNIARGPADNFAKALRQGDFKKAADELEAIKRELAKSGLDANQKRQLVDQLKQMQQKLKDLAEAHQDAQKNLQNRIDQLRRDGQLAEANKLEDQLNQLLQQGPQMGQLNDLANKLGQCAECLSNGQLGAAGKALGQLQADLENLQQRLDEMAILDEAMHELTQARNRINCPLCGGLGCKACQGEPGPGMGAGRGKGPRPEAQQDTAFYDSQVRPQVGKGSAVVTDLVDGPNVKGNPEQQIRQVFDAARRGDTDPLTDRRIPRKHKQHVTQYFNRFREGK